MKKHIRIMVSTAILCWLVLGSAAAVQADDKGEEIKTLSLEITSSVEANSGPGEVTVTTTGTRFRITSYDFVNAPANWKAGDEPKVKIILDANDGYFFSSSLKSSRIHLVGAKYSSMRKRGTETLEVTVKLKTVEGTLENVENADWAPRSLGKAEWDKVAGSPAYEIKLYRGDTMVQHVDRVATNYCNLYPFMTTKGTYYFKVRAVGKESNKDYLKPGGWCESSDLEISDRETAPKKQPNHPSATQTAGGSVSGPNKETGWIQNPSGWWYKNLDGSYPINRWQLIDGKWYLFDMQGYMKTGWQTHNGKTFYLSSNGDMIPGWVQLDRTWYYIDPDNGMQRGWLQLDGAWYYLDRDGARLTGWQKWNDKWYYLDPATGQMAEDKLIDSYYVNSDGVWVPEQ